VVERRWSRGGGRGEVVDRREGVVDKRGSRRRVREEGVREEE
jgi:hypothetical protein